MSANRPFFSVVIPLYNKRPHIKRSVGSVLAQTFRDFELIVVDDGSTDGSLDEIENIDDSRLKICHKENGGAASARNLGTREASAEYVAFLDADDEWHESFLEIIHLMSKVFPDAVMFSTGCQIVGSGPVRHKTIRHKKPYFIIEDYFSEFAKMCGPINNSSSSVVRKDYLINIGLFPVGYRNFEDWSVWFKLALLGPVAFSRQILSTIHLDSINREHHYDSDIGKLRTYCLLVEDIEIFLATNKIEKQNIDLVFNSKAVSFLRNSIKKQDDTFIYEFKKSTLYKYLKLTQKIAYLTWFRKIIFVLYRFTLFVRFFYSSRREVAKSA